MINIRLSKLRHYKILTLNDNDNFIINLEGNIINTIFPTLLWFFPQKAYKISNEQVLMLESKKNKIEVDILLVTGISLILSKISYPIIDKLKLGTSFQFSTIILLLSFIICVLAKLLSYKKDINTLSSLINLNECQLVKIRLLREKSFIKDAIISIISCAFLLLLVLLNIYIYLESISIFFLIAFVFCTYIFLFSTTTVNPPIYINDIEVIK